MRGVKYECNADFTGLKPSASKKPADMFKKICLKFGLGTETLDPLPLFFWYILSDSRILQPPQNNVGV
jgi:hypothetical protein